MADWVMAPGGGSFKSWLTVDMAPGDGPFTSCYKDPYFTDYDVLYKEPR